MPDKLSDLVLLVAFVLEALTISMLVAYWTLQHFIYGGA